MILRMLFIKDLRKLQTQIDEMIVQVQVCGTSCNATVLCTALQLARTFIARLAARADDMHALCHEMLQSLMCCSSRGLRSFLSTTPRLCWQAPQSKMQN